MRSSAILLVLLQFTLVQTPSWSAETRPVVPTSAEDGQWRALGGPSGRYGHAAVYDPMRGRLIIFGGEDNAMLRQDVWTLSLTGTPEWTSLVATGTPPSPRRGHSMIYDPVRDRVIVFGGWDGARRNDVWELALSPTPSWTLLTPTGVISARDGHSAIYDPVRDRMIVFGGAISATVLRNDVVALALSGTPTWSTLTTGGPQPAARTDHSVVYDPGRDRMVIFGGAGATSLLSDARGLSLSGTPTWGVIVAGTPPSARRGHAAIFDPIRDRMVVACGNDGSPRDDLWELAFTGSPAWHALSPTGLTAERSEHTATYDAAGDRMVTFGGDLGAGAPAYYGLVHELTLGTPAWNFVTGWVDLPGRHHHTAIRDPIRDRILVYGGDDNITLFNEVLAASLAGSLDWSFIGDQGPARSGHVMVYDPVRDRMLVFGGYGEGNYTNDVWVMSLGVVPSWSLLGPIGAPPDPRVYHSAIYDPVRDRVIVYGGLTSQGIDLGDLWELSLAGTPMWSPILASGTPPSARANATVVYDPEGDRMLLFGGEDSAPTNDVWELSLSGSPAWSALSPTGGPPAARSRHTAFYDAVRKRMVVFGGLNTGQVFNDVWSLSLSGPLSWTPMIPDGTKPPGRYGHAAIYDVVRNRMLVVGGAFNGHVDLGDTWELVWPPLVGVEGGAREGGRMVLVHPNPFRTDVAFEFELPSRTRLVLDVYDLNGRRVKRIVDAVVEAGRHPFTWRGDDESGRSMGPGVYFVRAVTPGWTSAQRIVRVE